MGLIFTITFILALAAMQLLPVVAYLAAVRHRISGFQSLHIPLSVSRIRNLKFFNSIEDTIWPLFKGSNVTAYEESFTKLDEVDQDMRRAHPVLFGRILAAALMRIVRRRTDEVSGLQIKVIAGSNHDIVRGKVDTIEMKFDKISYAQVHVSGGGKVVVKDLSLRMRRFLFRSKQQSIKKPYAIYCDALFTQQDIVNSKVIRNIIQLLADTILERVLNVGGLMNARISKVTIHSRRLHVKGTAQLRTDTSRNRRALFSSSALGLDGTVDFELSTGAAVRAGGQTVYLKNIQVALNPDSSLRTVMPILTSSPIDVDLGEDCRIHSLVIGNRNVWLRAASVISPVQPFHVVKPPARALYHYDMSAFLSSLLRLNGGVLGAVLGRWGVKSTGPARSNS